MRIFLDTCCLNRPWDDQCQLRIHLEAEAVLYLVEAARLGKLELVTSDYLIDEILCQPDPVRCAEVLCLTAPAALHVAHQQGVTTKAQTLASFNIHGHDAFHVASAEHAQCDFLLTTDDRLQKRCERATRQKAISIQVLNPTQLISHFPP